MSPRGGDGVYTRPAGIDAVTDTTIESAKYNLNVQDVEADLNVPRPISSGGTGASNAVDAMTNLGGEIANQTVTNYDTFPFKSGSFISFNGATAQPPLAEHYTGTCVVLTSDLQFVTLEAVSSATGVHYTRQKQAGLWGAWLRDASDKVAKAGDTMTGDLNLVYANPAIVLAGAGGGNCVLVSRKGANVAANSRWGLYLGDAAAEGGGNTGSDFSIARCADGGSVMDYPIYIKRVDGHIVTNGYVPSGANDLVNKAYVDGTGTTGLAGKVSKSGDTMSGGLIVGGDISSSNSGNDALAFLSTSSGSYGLLQASNAANSAPKNLVINQFGGNVGIGITTPGAKLDVNGNVNVSSGLAVGAGVQAIGGVYYFQDGGKNLTYSGGQFTFNGGPVNINGNLAVTGSITANGVPVGGRVLLATLTASNSATLTDTTSLTATYPTYEIVFENILPATNNDQLRLRVRSGGTFQAGAGSYVYMQYIVSTLPSNAAASGVSTFLPLSNSGAAGVGNNVSGLDGTIRLQKPTSGVFKDFYGQVVHDSLTQNNMLTIGGSWHGSTAVIDGLEFAFVGGNIASGVIRIYGLL